MGGHVHDPLTRPQLPHSLAQLHAIAARHDDIENDEIHSSLGLAQHLECLDGAVRLEQPVTLLAEDARGEPTRDALIVDNENGRGITGIWMVQSRSTPGNGQQVDGDRQKITGAAEATIVTC
jgi:hypothetical protein